MKLKKQMYAPRLYKYRDSSVLYTPTVQISVPYYTHTLFWYRHKHMTFPPPSTVVIRTWQSVFFAEEVFLTSSILSQDQNSTFKQLNKKQDQYMGKMVEKHLNKKKDLNLNFEVWKPFENTKS